MADSPLPLSGRVVVLGVGGSISAYKAADLCSRLVQEGARVLPILTRGALRFIAPATFWGLSAEPVSTDTFEEPFPGEIGHLRYAELADLFVIAPASADLLARVAVGLCDDMLTSALIANPGKPVLVAPAMNTNMWTNAVTQANRRTLEERGYQFLEPGVGRLAEGVVGAGRLAEPPEIVESVRETLYRQADLANLPVLVTAGPTREMIDPVRYISNRSSGKMGYAIAAAAAARGARVTLVTGPTTLPLPAGMEQVVSVMSAAEMLHACREHAAPARVVIAAAAVADYAPVQVSSQKLKKQGDDTFTLTLKPTEDILRHLAREKRDGQMLIGFAAETEALETHAQSKLEAKNLDMIVANDVTEEGAGFDVDTNIVTLISRDAPPQRLPRQSKRAVADAIWDWIVNRRLSAQARA